MQGAGCRPRSHGMQQPGEQASGRPRSACCAAAGTTACAAHLSGIGHGGDGGQRSFLQRKRKQRGRGRACWAGDRESGEGGRASCGRLHKRCSGVLRGAESYVGAMLHLHCSRAVQGCPSTPRQPPRTCTFRRPRCSRASSLPIRASRYGAMVSWSEASVGAGERAAGARQHRVAHSSAVWRGQ